jgi:hypothetical protein
MPQKCLFFDVFIYKTGTIAIIVATLRVRFFICIFGVLYVIWAILRRFLEFFERFFGVFSRFYLKNDEFARFFDFYYEK